MKKPWILLILMATIAIVPLSFAATQPSQEPVEPIECEVMQMTFGEMNALAEEMASQGDEAFLMLIEELQNYNISYEQSGYVIMGAQAQQVNGSISFGSWSTRGIGYGFPPGTRMVWRGEVKVFAWFYPEDENASTTLDYVILPPFTYTGPHAGGVVAGAISFFSAPRLIDAPALVYGDGSIAAIGVIIPLSNETVSA